MNNEEYFFHAHFSQKFIWHKDLSFHLGTVRPENKKQFAEGLKKLSRESIRNRFLGSKKEFSENELSYLTQLDGHNHYALGLELAEKPHDGIGVVRLVRSEIFENEAEVAITVIDEYHGKGLGYLLMQCAALAAMERKIEKLHFSFLPQNDGIIRLMSKLGPVNQGFQSMDYVQNYINTSDINLAKIKSQLRPFLPSIDTFHSKI